MNNTSKGHQPVATLSVSGEVAKLIALKAHRALTAMIDAPVSHRTEQFVGQFKTTPKWLTFRTTGTDGVLTLAKHLPRKAKLLKQSGIDPAKLGDYGFIQDDSGFLTCIVSCADIISIFDVEIKKMQKKTGWELDISSNQLWIAMGGVLVEQTTMYFGAKDGTLVLKKDAFDGSIEVPSAVSADVHGLGVTTTFPAIAEDGTLVGNFAFTDNGVYMLIGGADIPGTVTEGPRAILIEDVNIDHGGLSGKLGSIAMVSDTSTTLALIHQLHEMQSATVDISFQGEDGVTLLKSIAGRESEPVAAVG